MRRLSGVALLSFCIFVQVSTFAQSSPEFFAVSAASGNDLPPMAGFIGHPGVLAWNTTETARGTYNWKPLDGVVLKAPRVGNVAQVDLTLGYTPPWALANQHSCTALNKKACTAPPDHMKDWTDFLSALVAHYNGVSAPHVAYYEIWNEANNPLFWTGTVAQLAKMSQLAYPILKSDPYSQVITPSVVWQQSGSTSGVAWMTAFLTAGGLADVLSFHGYTSKTGTNVTLPIPLPESSLSTNAPLQTMITAYRQVADTNGLAGKPIVSTEGGWGVNGVSDPDMQAAWLAHYQMICASNAASANVGFCNWFEWGIPSLALSGTIENADKTPTAAGIAYEVTKSWVENQSLVPCSSSGTIWSCQVGSRLVVWDASQTCSAGVCTTLPYTVHGFSHVGDLTGAVNVIQNGVVELGVKPLLLE
jgi:hypothetical protein